jgi:hypothetical protein
MDFRPAGDHASCYGVNLAFAMAGWGVVFSAGCGAGPCTEAVSPQAVKLCFFRATVSPQAVRLCSPQSTTGFSAGLETVALQSNGFLPQALKLCPLQNEEFLRRP